MWVLLCVAACSNKEPPAGGKKPPPVPGLSVTVDVKTPGEFHIAAHNDSDDNLQLIWDESSFVGSSGKSFGRLLPDTTRKIDMDRPQPALPLPPHSVGTSTVIARDALPTSDTAVGAPPVENSGRLFIAIQTRSGKAMWQTDVSFRAEPEPFYCAASSSSGIASLCRRGQETCERARHSAIAAAAGNPTVGECQRSSQVWCTGVGAIVQCFATKDACEALHQSLSGSMTCVEGK